MAIKFLNLWAKIPYDKDFPEDSVQCDVCGGWGGTRISHVYTRLDIIQDRAKTECEYTTHAPCATCEGKGWLSPVTHPMGRACLYCKNPLLPSNYAVYCTNKCAQSDV